MKNTKRDESFLRETRHVIERHIELYPKCEPDDIVKLLYQSEFGCGHFVRSKEIAEEYLKRVKSNVKSCCLCEMVMLLRGKKIGSV